MSNDSIRRGVFMVHSPTDDPEILKGLLAKKFPLFKLFPPVVLRDQIFTRLPSCLMRRGVISTDFSKDNAELHFQGLHYTTEQMKSRQPVEELCQEVSKYTDRGFTHVGLGMLTASIGRKGLDVAEAISGNAYVTTGNALTSYTVAKAALEATDRVGYQTSKLIAVVMGAGGMVGTGISNILLESGVKHLLLVGSEEGTLKEKAGVISAKYPEAKVQEVSHIEGLMSADLLVTVSSSANPIVLSHSLLKPGVVIADAARPRDVAKMVAENRKDILVTEGGMLGYNYLGDAKIEMPSGILLPCVAETFLFTMLDLKENWTGDPTLEQMNRIGLLAESVGMKIVAFRLNDKPIEESEIIFRIENAKRQRRIG